MYVVCPCSEMWNDENVRKDECGSVVFTLLKDLSDFVLVLDLGCYTLLLITWQTWTSFLQQRSTEDSFLCVCFCLITFLDVWFLKCILVRWRIKRLVCKNNICIFMANIYFQWKHLISTLSTTVVKSAASYIQRGFVWSLDCILCSAVTLLAY